MPVSSTARIHPSAIISSDAEIGENVEIGALVVIDGPVKIGHNSVIKPGAKLFGNLSLGAKNIVYSGAILGEAPQHMKYDGEPTKTIIGNNNIIREGVTVHRGTTSSNETVIGNGNFLMANSHVAHDCRVGNGCILANGALMGGHCVMEDGAFLSGNSAVHQFANVGRLALLSGVSATTKDIPPFIIVQRINVVSGVNVIGMRRAGISHTNIDGIRKAFQIIYREGLILPQSLLKVEKELSHIPEVAEFIAFIRTATRGISLETNRQEAA